MNEKNDSLKKSIIVDTGVLIEFLENSVLGKIFSKHFLENKTYQEFYISPLTDTELKYILCRKSNHEIAKSKINKFLKDFIIFSEKELRDEAFQLKCNFSISLADCYSLAIGKLLNIPVLMKKESEIQNLYHELSKNLEIFFIDDFQM
ncbi:MAG: type II toxin-antitoxin system VapC family toxin [Promethearchaeota archaeon]|nr:MAG: type II toxin-antitoxin system VapC family toxin [Candidatus Lokiarchaeota archaeon]